MTQRKKQVIVVGCGIAGATVAMALQRAGLEPVIHEAHPGEADGAGLFLNLAVNGLAALQALGVAPADVVREGFPTPRMVLRSGTGQRLGEVPNGATLADGLVSHTITRGLLNRALKDEARRRGIAIVTGRRLRTVEGGPGDLVAHFEDGSEARGDLLVGADGLHSRVRSLIDPACPAPRFTGQLSLGGRVPNSGLEPTLGAYEMIFGHRAFFGYAVRPSGEAYWFANTAGEERPSQDPAHWKPRLLELFAPDAGPATRLIQATGGELAAYPIFDLPRVPRWHREGLAILGDAAHATSPSSGQGASMAIEDALVLARCLRDEADHARAFAAYERQRRARVERVVHWSARVGSTKVPGPLGRRVRDLLMPLALRWLAGSDSQRWLFDHHLAWD